LGQPDDRLAASVREYENGYYEYRLQVGLEFQDHVAEVLYQNGIVLGHAFSSRKAQVEKGENKLGAEIKKDMNFRKTGNLYIETAEKAHPLNPRYVPSGIWRRDNSWLFVIGDEETLWVFSVKQLRVIAEQADRRGYRKVQTPTSRAVLLPLPDADKISIRKIEHTEAA